MAVEDHDPLTSHRPPADTPTTTTSAREATRSAVADRLIRRHEPSPPIRGRATTGACWSMTIVRREGLAATSIPDPSRPAGFAATYTRFPPRVARVELPGVTRRFQLAPCTAHKPFAPCRRPAAVRNPLNATSRSAPRPPRNLPSIPDRPTAGRAALRAIMPADAHGQDSRLSRRLSSPARASTAW